MELSNRPNLIINGVSKAGGGEYGRVSIDGVGTVEGNIVSMTFDSNGMTKVHGDLVAGELDCDGHIRINGHVTAQKSIIDGNMKVMGSLRADHCTINGIIKIGGDCEIEQFNMEGAFEVQGLLNAGRMELRLHGPGKAREIGVESIQVRPASRSAWSKLWRWMLPKFTPELHSALIEGDDIDLENTVADIVRGNRIVIGKGCSIGTVEYRTALKVHPGAKVGKEVKIGG